LAGLPGAPVRINQAPLVYHQQTGIGIVARMDGPALSGTPPQLQVILPNQGPGPTLTGTQLTTEARANVAREIVATVLGAGRRPTSAQQAIIDAIVDQTDPDDAIAAAARRFAALPTQARRAWLNEHLPMLRSGVITLDQLP
jgi:hypothetical protein